MSQTHEVYVIYRDGEPFKGNRAAYYSKGDANAAVTRIVTDVFWRDRNAEMMAQERRRYAIVAYIAKRT